MKRVISLLAASLMTLLIGCSFSKDNDPIVRESKENKEINLKDLAKIKDSESAIKYLPEENIRDYFKDTSSKDLNAPFASGKTAIEVAYERGNTNVLKDLLSIGASPYVPNSKTGISPFERALAIKTPETISVITNDSTFYLFWKYLRVQRQKSSILLSKKNYAEFLAEFNEKHLPCDVYLEDLIQKRSSLSATSTPTDFIQKFLKSSSCETKFNKDKAPALFLREYNLQTKASFRDLTIMKFLSEKLDEKPAAKILFKDNQKKIFTTPAVLLNWSLKKKGSAAAMEKLEKIHMLSKMPHDAAMVISPPQSNFPTKDDVFITKDELFQTKDKELLNLLSTEEEKNSQLIERLLKMETEE